MLNHTTATGKVIPINCLADEHLVAVIKTHLRRINKCIEIINHESSDRITRALKPETYSRIAPKTQARELLQELAGTVDFYLSEGLTRENIDLKLLRKCKQKLTGRTKADSWVDEEIISLAQADLELMAFESTEGEIEGEIEEEIEHFGDPFGDETHMN